VFKGVQSRMVSGYLSRDVINNLNDIHFIASDALHTLVSTTANNPFDVLLR